MQESLSTHSILKPELIYYSNQSLSEVGLIMGLASLNCLKIRPVKTELMLGPDQEIEA